MLLYDVVRILLWPNWCLTLIFGLSPTSSVQICPVADKSHRCTTAGGFPNALCACWQVYILGMLSVVLMAAAVLLLMCNVKERLESDVSSAASFVPSIRDLLHNGP